MKKKGYELKNIQEMNIRFLTDLRNMTYKHYLIQPKSMIEWCLIKKFHKNPEPVKIFENTFHPLIRKYIKKTRTRL